VRNHSHYTENEVYHLEPQLAGYLGASHQQPHKQQQHQQLTHAVDPQHLVQLFPSNREGVGVLFEDEMTNAQHVVLYIVGPLDLGDVKGKLQLVFSTQTPVELLHVVI